MKHLEEHLNRVVYCSMQKPPEEMLSECLDILIDISGASGGSILGEEGAGLSFLFSDVPSLIGMVVPWTSIAGTCVSQNILIYTYAPSDKRHFDGIGKEIQRDTRYLLSIPIPSIHNARAHAGGGGRACGAVQLLFESNIFPDFDVTNKPAEFGMEDIRDHDFYKKSLKQVFVILSSISMGMEIMNLRQTSYQAIHELKNKLISAHSWVNCLKEDIEMIAPNALEDEDIIEDFSLAIDAVEAGSKIAVGYLQLSKLYSPEFTDADINQVLAETSKDIGAFTTSAAGEDSVDILLDVTEGIGTFRFDPAQIKMALFNLGKNAGEALLEHGVREGDDKPCITLSSSVLGDRLQVTVADNGKGMPEDIANNLFVAFKTKKEGGTGLGLTITKKIVDVHGGSIRCETGDTGTSFTILL